jgi:hypothetical protein
MMREALAWIAGTAMLMVVTPAWAVVESAYTPLDLAKCRMEPLSPQAEQEGMGGVFWCVGYNKMPVRVSEGDLRFFVSYGPNAANEPAVHETVPGFNRIHTTLEWRVSRTGQRVTPIATILRYFEASGPDGSTEVPVLVVTRLGGPGQVCHVGYVAVRSNPQANTIAREVADKVAPNFRCGVDSPVTYGPGMRP